jgi:hypothetical protein
MTEKHESEKVETTEAIEQKAVEANTPAIVEGEFKVTVRKLEMPVRPRGVLAE